ncbi:MAG TPA: carbamate kinase [Pirellulales bacterium]|jgi:carbamate kinase|nr:carbamate kinase [Pirellulales bacterium]
MLIVVALGGNAVSPPGQEGNIPQQYATTRAAIRPLADLMLAGHQLVMTHGNGPQVGNVMRRVEIAARHHVYPLPLDTVVADTQAGMGYMISQCLMNELTSRGHPRLCSTIITTVRVTRDDAAFSKPAKPVGPFMPRDQAEKHMKNDGWLMIEDSGRGWRRVVASPLPREIVEMDVIRSLVLAGQSIVACGGGGIPVVQGEDGQFAGVEAVIDKDRTTAMLAVGLQADMLAYLTGVDYVQQNFGTPNTRPIKQMTVTEARALLQQGQFPEGSMGPKVEGGVEFLERTPQATSQVLITSCEKIKQAMAGKIGTRIVRN